MRQSPEEESAETAALPIISHHNRYVMALAGPGPVPRHTDDSLVVERDERLALTVIHVDQPFEQRFVWERDRRTEAAIDGFPGEPPEEAREEFGVAGLEEPQPQAPAVDPGAGHLFDTPQVARPCATSFPVRSASSRPSAGATLPPR